jgi:hypothetical protein
MFLPHSVYLEWLYDMHWAMCFVEEGCRLGRHLVEIAPVELAETRAVGTGAIVMLAATVVPRMCVGSAVYAG